VPTTGRSPRTCAPSNSSRARRARSSWLKLQGKYGVGNEIIGAIDQHVNNMARTIALHEIYGPNPDATFAALMRKVKEGEGSSLVRGTRWLDSPRALQLTYDNLTGRGHPIANEFWARFWSGARDVVGVASLRNLPITIIPGRRRDVVPVGQFQRHVGVRTSLATCSTAR
jgi:hypothetical protein